MSRETPEARAARILAELRAATVEAAGVLKDLQAAARKARGQVDEYLHSEVENTLNGYVRQVEEHGLRVLKLASAEVNRVSQNAVNRATETIEAATGIQMLADAVAKEIARHTVYVDGEPQIIYGYGTDPDKIELKD